MSDQDWRDFDAKMLEAFQRLAKREGAPFKELWSQSEDVTIFGAFGGVARGWSEVGPRLDWAISQFFESDWSRERFAEHVGDDFACTVDYERGLGGSLVLRVTHFYRRENGRWCIVHRQADPLAETRTQAETLDWLAKR